MRCCVELMETALRWFWRDDSEYLKNGTSERKDEPNAVPSHKDVSAGRLTHSVDVDEAPEENERRWNAQSRVKTCGTTSQLSIRP